MEKYMEGRGGAGKGNDLYSCTGLEFRCQFLQQLRATADRSFSRCASTAGKPSFFTIGIMCADKKNRTG